MHYLVESDDERLSIKGSLHDPDNVLTKRRYAPSYSSLSHQKKKWLKIIDMNICWVLKDSSEKKGMLGYFHLLA